SIGILNMATVTFNAGSLFEVELDPNLGADLLNVTGVATIDPTAKVKVLPQPGLYVGGADYLILDAGTRNGAFGGVVDTSAFLDFTLDQMRNANQVWLRVTTVANFADVAETP